MYHTDQHVFLNELNHETRGSVLRTIVSREHCQCSGLQGAFGSLQQDDVEWVFGHVPTAGRPCESIYYHCRFAWMRSQCFAVSRSEGRPFVSFGLAAAA